MCDNCFQALHLMGEMGCKKCGAKYLSEVEALRNHVKYLEDKLYLAKVQESLYKPIIDEYGKVS